MKIPSVILNGKRTFAPESREDLINYFVERKGILVAMNAEKILMKDPELTVVINDNIGYPDGVGSVIALKKNGLKSVKIPGVELWLDIIKKHEGQKSFYLIGCREEVIQSTVDKLKVDYPNINIVGHRNGFLSEEDEELLQQDIASKKPDFVFVAMGSPRQEKLMMKLKANHLACYMGLGGSFNVYTGIVKRAPVLFQRFGCEWLFRLLKEPTRIGRQMKLVRFILLLSFNKL
jgi:UDP-N-acetyl-D-mannosaminouronate:lipid I N-acetyl-D-mannosaminouronosyltransferase